MGTKPLDKGYWTNVLYMPRMSGVGRNEEERNKWTKTNWIYLYLSIGLDVSKTIFFQMNKSKKLIECFFPKHLLMF